MKVIEGSERTSMGVFVFIKEGFISIAENEEQKEQMEKALGVKGKKGRLTYKG